MRLMNDYIGGASVPVARDTRGRVSHQAERNLFLPQPNYMAFYGGKLIDVTKLEWNRYDDRQRSIYWKTVKSDNGSARFDDGIITFAEEGGGATRVTVVGRQQFTLPLVWQLADWDLMPTVKDLLVTQAYTSFFTRTMANIEAQYEGRDIRIGRAWNDGNDGPEAAVRDRLPLAQISKALERTGGILGRILQRLPVANLLTPKAPAQASRVDEAGFVYFPGGGPVRPTRGSHWPVRDGFEAGAALSKLVTTKAGGFLADIAEAIRKDCGLHREMD